MAIEGLLKMALICKKGYDIEIYAYDDTNRLKHILDVIMWLKFGNCISKKEIIKTLIFLKVWSEKQIF